MRLKRLLSFVSAIVLISLLCSCVGGNTGSSTTSTKEEQLSTTTTKGDANLGFAISPSDKSLIDLVSVTYEDAQLNQIAGSRGSLDALNEQYPIECLRQEQDFYRVSYLGRGAVAVLWVDGVGNVLWGAVYPMQHHSSDYDGLEAAQTLDEVMTIDPEGDYLFLYTGRNDVPRESHHYTADGYCITVAYGAQNEIVSITKTLI